MWDESADQFVVGTTTATASSTGNISHTKANLQAAQITGSSGVFTSTGISSVLTVNGTDDGAGEGPDIVIKRNSASPADEDILGALVFKGENSADEAVTYGKVRARATDVTDGTEDGKLELFAMKAGSSTLLATLDSTSLFLNTGLSLTFEGATANAHETTLGVVDPDGDRTINLPNVSGTLPVLAVASTTQITSTPEELNILDDVTATTAELNYSDTGASVGTVVASKVVTADANKDVASFRNITLTGELDAGSLDVSGDADIDGTLEADAITIGGVTLAETISDTVGAMVTSNTETGVTVTYDDNDNTLDFVIGTLNQDTTGNAATATALETARTIAGQSFDGTGNIAIASTDLSNTSAIALLTASQTMTNKTLTSPQVNTQLDMLARAELRFQDASGGQYVALEAPATVSSNVTFVLPSADGTEDQVLTTDGSGTLAFADAAGGSGFTESTITIVPGKEGNFDLAKTNNTGDAESGLTSGATDQFGVALGSVFTMMEPVGSNTDNNTDLGQSGSI